MLEGLAITSTRASRLPSVDFADLGFGDQFSDHVFSMVFVDGRWRKPEIVPYGPISVDPGCLALHYGQSVFEGLKAFRGVDGKVRIFRPEMNEARLRESCRRLCVPTLDKGLFTEAIRALVRIDHAWIPGGRGQALYIRPLIFAEESHLEVRPAIRYRLIVMTAPVRTYYENSFAAVGLKVQDNYTRAAPGGVGFTKTAGNYAASLLPGDESREEGFDQCLWLDGAEHRYVEEVGHMNIFFQIAGRVVTPDLRGTILPGVTRDSLLVLLAEKGFAIEERRVPIDEVTDAIQRNTMDEAFGAGTAAVVAPVGRISYRGRVYEINDNQPGPLGRALYDELVEIQLGEIEDRHGWNLEVELDPSIAAPARA